MGTALLGGRREASISQHSLPSWPRSCPWSAGLGRALLSSLACSASRGPTLLGVIITNSRFAAYTSPWTPAGAPVLVRAPQKQQGVYTEKEVLQGLAHVSREADKSPDLWGESAGWDSRERVL